MHFLAVGDAVIWLTHFGASLIYSISLLIPTEELFFRRVQSVKKLDTKMGACSSEKLAGLRGRQP